MELQKLIFFEVPGMDDQYLNSYDTKITRGSLDDLVESVTGGGNLSKLRLARHTSSIISPIGTGQRAAIANGWGERRIKFAMVALLDEGNWSKEYAYIVGYTDKVDYGQEGRRFDFSPDTRMYFDSVTKISVQERVWRGDKVYQPKLLQSDQILNRDAFGGNGGRTDRGLLRPADLFRRREMTTEDAPRHWTNNGASFTSMVGSFNATLMANNRLNNSPTNYAYRASNAYLRGAESVGNDYEDADPDYREGEFTDQGRILAAAVDRIEENLLTIDPLFDQIKRDTNYLRQGWIHFGDLVDMNPDYDFENQHGFKPLDDEDLDRYQGNLLSKSDRNEAIASRVLAHALPGLMIACMWSRVSFVIDTLAIDEEGRVIVDHAWPFMQGMDVRARHPYFMDEMLHVVLQDISHGGRLDIEARVEANLDGWIEIWISIDGGEEAYIPYPSFASSLTAPVMADDLESVDRVGDGILTMVNAIAQGHQARNPSHIAEQDYGAAPFSASEGRPNSRKSNRRERSSIDNPEW